jgi:N-acetylglucosamine-6-phosphate deacetylase
MTATSIFWDLQINGFGGVDFNKDDLSADELHGACERLAIDGVTSILATLITEQLDLMCHRIAKLAKLREHDPLAQRLIHGLHIEGPFLNPAEGYRGAHPSDAIRPAEIDAARRLVDAGAGLVRLVTLAPEQDVGFQVTRWLVSSGIIVSAGHTNASIEQLRGAIDAGLTMFTHLGNGCPQQLPRHDNIVQRALSFTDRLWLCFIADGVHVPFFALRNYVKMAGANHCIVVTDAMAAAGLGPGRYTLGRWEVLVGKDMVARPPDGSHLVGSATTMKQSFENLLRHIGLTAAEAVQLTSINPRRALKKE